MTHGLVRACLERRGDVTILGSHYARYPLRILAPQPPREYAGALLYLGMVAGGIRQDDQLEVRLELKAGAEALVTTQAASKVLSMVGDGGACQRHQFTLGDGAVLEYLPDELIPFHGARFVQETRVDMAASATVMLAELLAPGRVARNERFDYCRLVSDLSVRRDGHLVVRDVADVEPQRMRPFGRALFGGHGYYASLVIVGPRADAALADEIADLLDQADLLASASATPHVVVVRLLGPAAGVVKAGLRAAWQVARLRLVGQALPTVPGKLAF